MANARAKWQKLGLNGVIMIKTVISRQGQSIITTTKKNGVKLNLESTQNYLVLNLQTDDLKIISVIVRYIVSDVEEHEASIANALANLGSDQAATV